jgi:hypothetical protein
MAEQSEKTPEIDPAAVLEAEVVEAIAICGGDVRAALRTSLIANAFLEAEIERLSAQVSTGFARGRVRSLAKKKPAEVAGNSEQSNDPNSLPQADTPPIVGRE